ncbi:MAG TPA: OmpA family protein [Myxococcota bacterium]|jgi:outer membrane protein OmpA-like peptidoglycan-associated protein|nr:OmpA family protein [Myxococcota bacterium]
MSRSGRAPAPRRAALVVVVLLAAAPAAAQAGSASNGPIVLTPAFDFERFAPTPDPRGVSVVESARTLGLLNYSVGFVLGYEHAPLRLCAPAATTAACYAIGDAVSGRFAVNVLAAIGFGPAELRLVAPFVLWQGTDFMPSEGMAALAARGAGDLRPGVKVRLYDKGGALALALLATATVPPGGDGANFIGDTGVTVEPRLLLDLRVNRLAAAVTFGYRWRQKVASFANLYLDDELVWSAGAEYWLMEERLAVGLAAWGAIGLFGEPTGMLPDVTHIAPGPEERPIEAAASVRFWITRNLAVEAGGGPGISSGYGTPSFRLFAGARWAHLVKDGDGDGIDDAADACPTRAEDPDDFEDKDGCPDLDNDHDGILDSKDGCPLDPEDFDGYGDEDGCPEADNDKDGIADEADRCPAVAEDMDGFEDADGCPDVDNDKDGIRDTADKCPLEAEDLDGVMDDDGCPETDNDADGVLDDVDRCPITPEDKDGFEDADGCPEPDNDKDGLVDARDKCPDEPETFNGIDDEDGCPDKGKTLVRLTSEKIEITDKIFFATSKATIKKVSFPILDAVASMMKLHAEIKVLRVEGHTDDVADDALNLKLSKARAESVRDYLVKAGVEPGRLLAEGYGETRPLDAAKTKAARALNRRVEFVIVDMEKPGEDAGGGTGAAPAAAPEPTPVRIDVPLAPVGSATPPPGDAPLPPSGGLLDAPSFDEPAESAAAGAPADEDAPVKGKKGKKAKKPKKPKKKKKKVGPDGE